MPEKRRRERVMVYVPEALRTWAQEQAEANFTSLNHQIIQALHEKRQRSIQAEQKAAAALSDGAA